MAQAQLNALPAEERQYMSVANGSFRVKVCQSYTYQSLARQPHVVFDSVPACKVMCTQQEAATAGSSSDTRVAVFCDQKQILECRSTAS